MITIYKLTKYIKPFEIKCLYSFPNKFYFSRRIQYEQYPVEDYQIGARLDRYLKKYPLGGWSSIQMLIRNKDIVIQNKQGQLIKQNSYIMKQGDFILINKNLKHLLKETKGDEVQQQNSYHQISYQKAKQILDQMIIFNNANIAIFNKTSGFTVQGGTDFDKNIFSLMKARYKRDYVHICHRLDKPTSGILFFAKNLKTAQLIQSAMEHKEQMDKIYLAYTTGQKIQEKQGYLRSNIEWSPKKVARVCGDGVQGSKDSITYYKVLKQSQIRDTGQYLNLLGLKILTGRKHQIRCHLKDLLNNKIINDIRYKAERNQKLQQDQILLHASRTVINNKQIITKVFNFKEGYEIINKNGQMRLQSGKLVIEANVPSFWDNIVKFQDQTDSIQFSERQRSFKKNLKKKTKVLKIQ